MRNFPGTSFSFLAGLGALATAGVCGTAGAEVPGDTKIDLQGVTAELPGTWQKHPGPPRGTFVYRSADGLDQVTITVRASRKHLSMLDCRDASAKLVAHRQKAERKRLGEKTRFKPTSSMEREGVFLVGYYGTAPTAPHFFATYIACTKLGLWTFFHETRARDDRHLMKRASTILTTIEPTDMSDEKKKQVPDPGKKADPKKADQG